MLVLVQSTYETIIFTLDQKSQTDQYILRLFKAVCGDKRLD